MRHGASGLPTDVAAAHEAQQVDLGGRLGEREVRRAQPRGQARAEHGGCEVVERPLEVGHSDAGVDREALDLTEDGRVRGVELVGTERAAGSNDVDGQRSRQQRANLHRRGMRPQDQPRIGSADEERVLHGPCRVVRDEVQRVEVEPLGLDLGAFGHLPPHRHENVGDAISDQRQWVLGAAWLAVPRQRHVDGFLDQDAGVAVSLEHLSARLDRGSNGAAGGSDALARLGSRGWRQSADLTVGESERRAVAVVGHLHRVQQVEVGRRRDVCQRLVGHARHLVGMQRRDLDGVVRPVGRGHARESREALGTLSVGGLEPRRTGTPRPRRPG